MIPGLDELKDRTSFFISGVNYRKAEYKMYAEQVDKLRKTEAELIKSVELKTQTIAVFSQFTDLLWGETKRLVEELVTRGVQAGFGESLEFKVNFVTERNNIIAKLYAVDAGEDRDLLSSDGGGLCDMVSILLRVAILLLKRPSSDRILLLDEPMKAVSSHHIPLILDFLQALSDSFGVQFIIVTHHPEFEGMGHNYLLEKKNGSTMIINHTEGGSVPQPA